MVLVPLVYRRIYPDYETFDIISELGKLSANSVIRVIGQLNSWVYERESDGQTHLEIVKHFINQLPQEISEKLRNWRETIPQSFGGVPSIVTARTSLKMLDLVYKNFQVMLGEEFVSATQWESFFRCYIFLTQSLPHSSTLKKPSDITNFDEFFEILLPIEFAQRDIERPRDISAVVMKSYYFYQFCEANVEYNKLLDSFLKRVNCISWQQYLSHIVGVYFALKMPVPPSDTNNLPLINLYDPATTLILDSMCADLGVYKHEENYAYLRNNPVFKREDKYVVPFIPFFLDRLYDNLKFVLAQEAIGNPQFKNGAINDKPSFFSVVGAEFSETQLFYKVIESYFKMDTAILKSGDQIKENISNGGPDFYIRDKSNIFLFEFKDSLISHKVKQSYDFTLIEDELHKKLIRNERGKAKGLSQLVNNIEMLLDGVYQTSNVDDGIDDSQKIFPILVYTDPVLYAKGVNYYLNRKFSELLQSRGVSSKRIASLTMIHIDTLIIFADYFVEGDISFVKCLQELDSSLKNDNFRTGITSIEEHIGVFSKRFSRSRFPKAVLEVLDPLFKKGGFRLLKNDPI